MVTSKEMPRQVEPGLTGRDRLIVALDDPDNANELVATLGDEVVFYKVHWVLMLREGSKFVEKLIGGGKKVFLDLKMYDIDETIENAVRSISQMGVEFLTLHGNRATLKAAQRGRRLAGRANPKFLSVTLLSSLDQTDLKDILFTDNIALDEYIDKRTEQLLEAGCEAVIASGDSVADIRAKYGTRVIIVTPGIRQSGGSQNDHKRTLTPR